MILHKKVVHHLNMLKEKITSSCPSCSGEGCNPCALKYDYMKRLAKSGLPIKYWEYTFSCLNSSDMGISAVKKYADKLDMAYEEGKGVFIYGKNGNGKTLSACMIAKAAVRKGYTARFTFLGDIITLFADGMYDQQKRQVLRDDIINVDFLIIDDIDKAYLGKDSQYVSSTLDTLFRVRAQNNLPVIMTANKQMKDILESQEETYCKSLLSLFDESLLPITFMGKDRRKEEREKAMERYLND